ncbi:MAG: ABC transporter ATP-binding protein [Oscillospiraceae bacterium]|nr:ABC transporter ATP-binding protein [Oscillospiraceae bacterium]
MKLLIKDVKKSFEKKEVLIGASYTFQTGKIYGLLGRNGAGKTTLFNCINDDIPIDSGSISADENGICRALCADDIGYVLSVPVVPEFLTGREFLKFFIDINKDKIKNLRTIDEYFELMRIKDSDRDRLMKDYSHGMKNKMMMLVNLIAQTPVLLLDEPLTSFDVVVADEMKQLLRNIKSEHIIIFSTHIMELALDLCDEIIILNNGILEKIDKENLDNHAFKDRIISALRGEDDD